MKRDVAWQTATYKGRASGGTIGNSLSRRNMEVIDYGVPLLSIHSTYAVSSKVDVYTCSFAPWTLSTDTPTEKPSRKSKSNRLTDIPQESTRGPIVAYTDYRSSKHIARWAGSHGGLLRQSSCGAGHQGSS